MDTNYYFSVDPSQTSCSTPRRKQKKKTKTSNNNMNKRRFSDKQIRSLETLFYSMDSKLDLRKKVQVATELGLQPRQIAIWFQNRRARWKSKEMENNFRSLRANYDNLASQFITLQEENKSLLSQLQKLSLLLQGPRENPKSFHQDELKQSRRTYLLNNDNYNTNKCIVKGEGDSGLQMTHFLEERSNDISHVEEQAYQLFNPNGSFVDSDGGVIFEYQSCSSLQGLSFWG